MSTTRRGFLESTAAMAAGLTGAASVPQVLGQTAAPAGGPMPKVKFGKVEISRLIVGVNPFLRLRSLQQHPEHRDEGVVHGGQGGRSPAAVREVRHQRLQLRSHGPRPGRLGTLSGRGRPDAPGGSGHHGRSGGTGQRRQADGGVGAGRAHRRRVSGRQDGDDPRLLQEAARPGRGRWSE